MEHICTKSCIVKQFSLIGKNICRRPKFGYILHLAIDCSWELF